MWLRNRLFVSLALVAVLSMLAGPAAAHGRKWRGHYGYSHGHRHFDGYGHRYAPRYVARHRGYPVYHYAPAPAFFYCAACRHHFDSYDHLSYHVHRHHHISLLELPFVIVHDTLDATLGWIFHG
jgi:hypothetical protein